ncbi:MAG TPA: BRCT domain-containing protein [Planctomycetota bacterium]|nr:BRCT domain-containing protein [Planctomycetota bacterium]
MSTKQTVIFTFMILFLGVMLFAMGSFFYWSIEHSTREKSLEALKLRKLALESELSNPRVDEATKIPIGLKQRINDPQVGLKVELARATTAAVEMKGNEAGGTVEREIRYSSWEPKLIEIKPKIEEKWVNLYKNWRELDGKISASMVTLAKQKKDKDDKVEAAKQELQTELGNEEVARKKVIVERKKQADDISNIRYQHEEVQDKTSSVTREVTKKTDIRPQGKVIYSAAEDLKTVDIDKGAIDGIKRGMQFDVYSGTNFGLIKKGVIEITQVNPSSSRATVLPPKTITLQDPQTGWSTDDPKKRFSPYAASGADDTDAQELVKPKTKAERIETFRQEKLEKEMSLEDLEVYRRQKEAPATPPAQLGIGFVPIIVGDWIFNPDFVPVISPGKYEQQVVDEIVSMKDVNTGSLVFYFTDSVKPYRQEFLRRLCERNRCKVVDAMTNDVNYVVTSPGNTNADLLKEKLEANKETKDKEDVPAEIKNLRRTLAALQDGRKIGSDVISDDEMEAFFTRRQRKQELLRGKTVQPGQSLFYVAGETKLRSAEHLRKWIKDHNGVVTEELDAKVDYVVVGSGLNAEFYDKIKKIGLKIIREDELPKFFGVENEK